MQNQELVICGREKHKGGGYVEDKFTEILTRLAVIESKIDDYKTIRNKAENAENRSLHNEKEIKEIKDNNRWLWRTVIGILITGGMAILFNIK